MEIGAAFVAGPEAFELVEPGESAFHDPTFLHESGAVDRAAAGDPSLIKVSVERLWS